MQDGNDKGFALYDVNGGVRDDLASDNDLNEIFGDLENAPVELLEEPKEFEKRDDEEDLSDLDLSAGTLDKSNDSVRVYLREMGMVPLLTREGEIELAKRIERGENAVRKALSRSPLVIREILNLEETIRQDTSTVRDILIMPDLVVTDENIVEQSTEILNTISE